VSLMIALSFGGGTVTVQLLAIATAAMMTT
jgi:hypothetical protein